MRFFRYFPTTIDINGKVLVNLSKKILLGKNLSDQSIMFYKYILSDGERLDTLAKKVYDSEEYQWVIMLVNGMFDPRQDLPMSSTEFDAYITDQYGSVSNAMATVHHLEDENGEWVDSEYPFIKYEISVYDYEDRINERKRQIKLVRQEYIGIYAEELKRVLGQ